MEIQGQEVLSLQEALHYSTHQNIRLCHHKILHPMHNFLQTHLQEPVFLGGFTSDAFLKRPVLSYWDSYEKFLQGDLQAKVVPERTTYPVTWGVLQRVPSSVSTRLWLVVMRKEPQEPGRTRRPQERDVEQSAPTHARHTPYASRQLGTTADWRYDVPQDWLWEACRMATVRWGTHCKEFCSKEGLLYQMEWSAKNHLECDQVQRAPEKLSRSCRLTSNNQLLFVS